MYFADTFNNSCHPALPAPQVRGCFFEEVLEPRLSGMDLDWDGPAAEEPATWRLPQGVTFMGPAPARFGIHVRRLGPDHYVLHLIWDRVHLAFKDLTRCQVRESCLGPLLARMGTDLEYLLDQPPEISSSRSKPFDARDAV